MRSRYGKTPLRSVFRKSGRILDCRQFTDELLHYQLEPLSPAICIASSRLSEFHGDPADRLIVATAMTLGLPLMTADKKIIEWNQAHSAIQILHL